MKKLFFFLLLAPVWAFAQTTSTYTVSSISMLKTLTIRPAVVFVLGPNPGIFSWSTVPCSAADDTFEIAPTSDPAGCFVRMASPHSVGKSSSSPAVDVSATKSLSSISQRSFLKVSRSLESRFSDVVSVLDFGAKCDGVTDDVGPIQHALDYSANKAVIIPGNGVGCRISSFLTVPKNVELRGEAFLPGNPTISSIEWSLGSFILCDASVNPCISMGAAGTNWTSSVRKLSVRRAGGVPAKSLTAIRINGYNTVLEDVAVFNHGIGFYWASQPAQYAGIAAYGTRLFTGAISGSHLVLDSFAEVRIEQSRFGMNGPGDYAGDAFISLTGGVPGTAAGPNTFNVANSQFNQGTNPPKYWIQFINCTAPCAPSVDARIWNFTNVHVEGLSVAGIYSDSTWTALWNFSANAFSFNNPTKPLFALNPATQVVGLNIFQSLIGASSLSLTPTGSLTDVNLVGNRIEGPVTLAPGSSPNGNNAMVHGNSIFGDMTISGAWASLSRIGNRVVSGAVNDTSTGKRIILDPGADQNHLDALTIFSYSPVSTQPFDVGGMVANGNIRSRTMNLSTANGSTAEVAVATGLPNSFATFTVDNKIGTPEARLFTASGVASLNFDTPLAKFPNSINYGGVTLSNSVTGTGSMVLSTSPTITGTLAGSNAKFSGTVRLGGYTVATLPVSPETGVRAYVTDAVSCAFGGAVTGGGSTYCPVTFNGTAWQGG